MNDSFDQQLPSAVGYATTDELIIAHLTSILHRTTPPHHHHPPNTGQTRPMAVDEELGVVRRLCFAAESPRELRRVIQVRLGYV